MSRPDLEQEAVAVVGMAGRFPGARNVEEYWRNLRQGRESISRFTPEELAAAGVPREVYERPEYVPVKGVIDDPELFDAELFGFTPREAEVLDPQQRVFLECCWQACEDAGYGALVGERVGVYAGSSSSSYLLVNLLSNPELLAEVGKLLARISNDSDFLTTRVSYKLDLRGPSVAVQTACSSSLVAIHLACQGLLDGECSMALAGGVSLSFPYRAGYLYQDGGIRSADGRCRAFDAEAGGSVEGNGAGVVVLKRLSDALADGDSIRAVIRGTAMNNDGSLKAGYTAPSVESQSRVIAEALGMAGVSAASVGYVEAHGSGTELGDPIEVEALTLAFRETSAASGTCALGSVKTAIGHLDAAAGVASLIKTVKALEEGTLPPSPYFRRPNPRIDLEASPFYVPTEARPWPAELAPRRAGVSSFGIGGTNVHVVLEEAPRVEPAGAARPWQLLVLSARSPAALERSGEKLATHLETERDETPLADVAYTLAAGRRRFRCRRALVCRDAEEARALLARPDAGVAAEAPPGRGGERRELAFLLPGLGDHHAGMSAELYREEPAFRAVVDRAAGLLEPRLGVDLRDLLYPEGAAAPGAGAAPGEGGPRRLSRTGGFEAAPESEADRRLRRTLHAHPALFTVEVALGRLLAEWGLEPRALLGYSLGEIAAACLAGVFSLEDGLALVAERARLIDALPPGAMLAVPLAEDELRGPLAEAGEELAVAATNGASMTVVAGAPEAVDELGRRLAGLGVACQPLRTTHAFHSPQMEPVREPLERLLRGIELRPPRVPFVSNVTGTWIRPEEATDPAYWAEHTVRPVRFAEGLGRLLELGGDDHPGPLVLEVGPGQGLATLVRQHPQSARAVAVASALPDRRDGVSELAHLLTAVGRMWCAGADVDWRGFYHHQRRRRTALPTYPFERRRFWIEPGDGSAVGAELGPTGGKTELAEWFYVPAWERSPMPRRERPRALAEERWLVFLDPLGVGERLTVELRRRGQQVTTVAEGEGFATAGEDAFEIAPGRREDYGALVAELASAGALPVKVAHLFALTGDADAGDPAGLGARLEELLDRGFYSLLYLAQAWGETVSGERSLEIVALTNHLWEVSGEEAISPAKAPLLGPLKVIPQEYPQIRCRGVDLTGLEKNADAVAGRLADELLAPPGREAFVALRGRHRWERTFRPLRLEAPPEPPPRLRRGGAYLVTGGAEETGLVVAEHLVERTAARPALFVPPDFPPRRRWEELAAVDDGEGAELAATLRRLLALEKRSGGTLLALAVDLDDPETVEAAVRAVRHRFKEIAGVLHTAAVPGGGLIQLKAREAAAGVLAPKVAGTLHLARAVRDLPLDFFALYSSTTAVTGGLGQVDFCAANAFCDAFARRAALVPGKADVTLSIGWGPFRWEAVEEPEEMAAMPGLWEQLQHNLETAGIDVSEAGEALERALAAAPAEMVVSPRRLEAVMRDFDQLTTASLLAEMSHAGAGGSHERPELAVAYAEPESELEQQVATLWREAFGLSRVGLHDNFFDLAGNSLLAIQIVTRARSEFEVELPMTALFEAPTVAELARRIEELRAAPAGDDEFFALLSEIESLPPEEVDARLATGAEPDAGG